MNGFQQPRPPRGAPERGPRVDFSLGNTKQLFTDWPSGTVLRPVRSPFQQGHQSLLAQEPDQLQPRGAQSEARCLRHTAHRPAELQHHLLAVLSLLTKSQWLATSDTLAKFTWLLDLSSRNSIPTKCNCPTSSCMYFMMASMPFFLMSFAVALTSSSGQSHFPNVTTT